MKPVWRKETDDDSGLRRSRLSVPIPVSNYTISKQNQERSYLLNRIRW